MSGKGKYYDNATVEMFFKTLYPNRVRHYPKHRWLLQPCLVPFCAQLPQPRTIRKTGGNLRQCLSDQWYLSLERPPQPEQLDADAVEVVAHGLFGRHRVMEADSLNDTAMFPISGCH